ncbi:ABC transporter ATP-binding protein [Chloroflexota bacterium]
MCAQPVIETVDLTKVYDDTIVVDKLNLRIDEGEIFGFLGPNGAGKTTTILMLLGLTEPTSGIARVGGYNSTREPRRVKQITGYLPEKVGFYEDLTAESNLIYMARLNRLSDEMALKRVSESLAIVGLSKVSTQKVRTFSRGMKQRLAIADILVKMPKVAIMDEPTLGIDPEGMNQILELIAKISKEQRMTIILSSHQLHQVQRICSRVGIMAKGQMVVEGSLEQLGRDTFGGGQINIEVQLTETNSDLVMSIERIPGVTSVRQSGESLQISCKEDLRPKIAKVIVDNNGLIVKMTIQSYALEDIYMKYFTEA